MEALFYYRQVVSEHPKSGEVEFVAVYKNTQVVFHVNEMTLLFYDK